VRSTRIRCKSPTSHWPIWQRECAWRGVTSFISDLRFHAQPQPSIDGRQTANKRLRVDLVTCVTAQMQSKPHTVAMVSMVKRGWWESVPVVVLAVQRPSVRLVIFRASDHDQNEHGLHCPTSACNRSVRPVKSMELCPRPCPLLPMSDVTVPVRWSTLQGCGPQQLHPDPFHEICPTRTVDMHCREQPESLLSRMSRSSLLQGNDAKKWQVLKLS